MSNIDILVEGAARKWCELDGIDPDKNWQSRADEVRRHIILTTCVKMFVADENTKRVNAERASRRTVERVDKNVRNLLTDRLGGDEG